MSTYESGEAVGYVQKSSVKIKQTAKGDAQVDVSVYDGTDEAELNRIRTLAVTAYRLTVADVSAAA